MYQSKPVDRTTLSVFILAVLFAGMNAIGVRYILVELPPFWGAFIRFLPASLIMFSLVAILRLPLPKGRALLGAGLYGLLNFGASYSFLYWGLQEVQAGLAQVLLALVPLFTLFAAVLHRQESFRWRAFIGALLALLGIAIVFGEQIRLAVPILSLLAIVLGAFCIAESAVIVKGFPSAHPITTNAIAMATGTVVLAIMTVAWGETPVLPTLPNTWFALIYLIVIGSCVAFGMFLYVLKRWTASATAYGLVIMPFVTLAASAWLTGEQITIVFLLGAALVLLGVYVGALAGGKKRANPTLTQPEGAGAGED
jgi:drug/metabolite transporter (DMT)-like permease